MAAEFNVFDFEAAQAEHSIVSVKTVDGAEVQVQAVDWGKVMTKFKTWFQTQMKKVMEWLNDLWNKYRMDILLTLKDVALETAAEAMASENWPTMSKSERRDFIYDLLTEKIKEAGIELGGQIISDEIPDELEDEIRLVIEFVLAAMRDRATS